MYTCGSLLEYVGEFFMTLWMYIFLEVVVIIILALFVYNSFIDMLL